MEEFKREILNEMAEGYLPPNQKLKNVNKNSYYNSSNSSIQNSIVQLISIFVNR